MGSKTFKLLSKLTGRVVDITGSSTEEGASSIQSNWNNNSSQVWTFLPLSSFDQLQKPLFDENISHVIRNVATGKFMTVQGSATFERVPIISTDFEDSKNQHWSIKLVSPYEGTYSLLFLKYQKRFWICIMDP